MCNFLQDNNLTEEMGCKDLDCIRRNIYIARKNVLPTLPKNRNEVFEAIQKIHTKTNKNEEFLSISDNENGIIVFSTFRNLHFLCSSDTIYMDGNFQFCTKFFCQMFTIQAFRNGYYIPVVFCLLPDKRTVTYAELFKKIIERSESDELVFKPSKIVIDFEQAIHSACSLFISVA
jgi:hypothetical protein